MNLDELVRAARSHRRFLQDEPVSAEVLVGLTDMARQTSSAGNLQPLKYVLCNEPSMNDRIFDTLGWAAYLKDWPGPEPGERPAAYIVVLQDESIAKKVDCDHGIAAWTIMLGAAEQGLAGCILANIKHKKLAGILDLPEGLRALLVVALGRPAETVVMEEVQEGDIHYYRDGQDVHHTPKRSLEEVVVDAYLEEDDGSLDPEDDELSPDEPETVSEPGDVEQTRPAKNAQSPMPTLDKAKLTASWLDEAKAEDVLVLDVAGVCPIAEAMVIATAGSARHAKGLAERVTDRYGEHKLEFLGMEGFKGGEWILVDCNDVVVHIFQDEFRRLYDLEGLWSEARTIQWSDNA